MPWITYVAAVRLEGHTWYYLLRIDDDLSVDHPLPSGVRGAGALFPTEAQARAQGRALNEPMSDDSPTPIDLDAVLAWCADPTSHARDDGLLMSSWYALADLDATEPPPLSIEPEEPGFALCAVADKVHLGYSLTASPESRYPAPTWSVEDLRLLAQTLEDAVRHLAAGIHGRAW